MWLIQFIFLPVSSAVILVTGERKENHAGSWTADLRKLESG